MSDAPPSEDSETLARLMRARFSCRAFLPDPAPEPSEVVTGHLLAIVGESLSNIARHSHATQATIELLLHEDGQGFTVRIVDNGRGFEPTGAVRLGHQGLANIRDRADRIGATMTIESELGAGTRTTIALPGHSEDAR